MCSCGAWYILSVFLTTKEIKTERPLRVTQHDPLTCDIRIKFPSTWVLKAEQPFIRKDESSTVFLHRPLCFNTVSQKSNYILVLLRPHPHEATDLIFESLVIHM